MVGAGRRPIDAAAAAEDEAPAFGETVAGSPLAPEEGEESGRTLFIRSAGAELMLV